MANYRQLARQKAKKYGLDPNVFERQIGQESGFHPHIVSPAGARGIAQIMPATARGWGVNPDDPAASLDAAAKNMAGYVKKYGSYKNALVAYNAGPGRVGGPLPAETQNYIKIILGGKTPHSTPAPSTAPAVSSPAVADNRKQIALSLLGLGNYGGDVTGGDPLAGLLTQALQQHGPKPKAPTAHAAPTPTASAGVTHFDGKPVAGWIVPLLAKARKTGLWKGTVTSGERTKSQQLAAAKNYGLQHYPHGPLASNHVYGNGGAVDVSDPEGLKRALKATGTNNLKSAMPEDPVHFSGTGY